MADEFGVRPDGFKAKTQSDILAEIQDDQRALSPLIDVSADRPLGQINGVYSRELALLWQVAQFCYGAFDPDVSTGDALTNLCKLTGTFREPARKSTVIIDVDLDTGTELIAGIHFVSLEGNPAVRFTPITGIIRDPPGGAVSLPFESEVAGPVLAPAGQLTVIATPVTGWNSANNANAATSGSDVETDSQLRADREQELAASGSSTVASIRADVLENVPLVQSCTVFENTTSFVDAEGRPPHSFEVLIYDGTPPVASDDEIAQAIWDSKPAGIRAFGTGESGNAIDSQGVSRIVEFSRVSQVTIYLTYVLVTGPGYIGNTALKALLAQAANSIYNVADKDVIALVIQALPVVATGIGVLDVTSFFLGTTVSPAGVGNISIGTRQIARFDSSRITIT